MNYIVEYPNALNNDFCANVIDRFEKDDRKHVGVVGEGYNPEVKQSEDLLISKLPEWAEADHGFLLSLEKHVNLYVEDVIKPCCWGFSEPFDSGYQIQKTTPGGFYVLHNDYHCVRDNPQYARMVTYIWYLNDVDEGGHTEFITGERIKPEQGKLLLFPSTWTFAHKGTPPVSNTKYICTGWIYGKQSWDS
jgi:hypothetical protein